MRKRTGIHVNFALLVSRTSSTRRFLFLFLFSFFVLAKFATLSFCATVIARLLRKRRRPSPSTAFMGMLLTLCNARRPRPPLGKAELAPLLRSAPQDGFKLSLMRRLMKTLMLLCYLPLHACQLESSPANATTCPPANKETPPKCIW